MEKIGGGIEYKTEEHDKMGFGLGLSVGWKYVSRGNWVGEIHAGLGRNFITPGIVVYPRWYHRLPLLGRGYLILFNVFA